MGEIDWFKVSALEGASAFKDVLERAKGLDFVETAMVIEMLEKASSSSSWATGRLFKPGTRNLFLQERLGATGMVSKLVNFLGDQYYHFKFFFQSFTARGELPRVVDMVKQCINMPTFRFRGEAIDLLVEFEGKTALPVLYNLVTSLDRHDSTVKSLVVGRIEANLDLLHESASSDEQMEKVFKMLRLELLKHS